MNTTAQRTIRRRQQLAILILLLAAASPWAQPPAEDSTAPETQTQAREAEAPAPAEPTAANGEEEAVAENPASANSPFDYRASEKISEDLSVSFPVDI